MGAGVLLTTIQVIWNIRRDPPSLPYQVLNGLIKFFGLSYYWGEYLLVNIERKTLGIDTP
jgi:hypothetical protein